MAFHHAQAYFDMSSNREPRFVMKRTRRPVSRIRMLTRIQRLLRADAGIPMAAIQLLGNVRFAAEELTEAGISYETVRALEKHYPTLLSRL